MLIDYDFQNKAIDEMIEHSCDLFQNSPGERNLIVLKAPTGSGKTTMAAKYIRALVDKVEKNLCFVWISIGKGELHMQSLRKLDAIFQGSLECQTIDDALSRGEISKNNILFLSWDTINKTEQKTGQPINKIMKEGENPGLPDLVRQTFQHREIILIIDESHNTARTESSESLIQKFFPSLVLNLSATPTYVPGQDRYRTERFVEVRLEDVIEEGLLKKEVYINDIIEDSLINQIYGSGKKGLELVLDAAIQRLEELKTAYKKEGLDIHPLCLIQIPDQDKGEGKKREIEDYLKSKGIFYDAGNLAVILSEEKENLEEIWDYQSLVSFLIFKTAIATGWDCPRAQILVKFRETKSEVFDIQTVGRILRMPEPERRAHYENELLNRAYVYTDNTAIQVGLEALGLIKYNKAVLKPDLMNLDLPSFYLRKASNIRILGKKIESLLYEGLQSSLKVSRKLSPEENALMLQRAGLDCNTDSANGRMLKFSQLKLEEFSKASGRFSGEEFSYELDDKEVEQAFIEELKNNWHRMYESIKPLWHKIFCALLGENRRDPSSIRKMQILYLKNQEKFSEVLRDVRARYETWYKNTQFLEEGNGEWNSFSLMDQQVKEDASGGDARYESFPATKYAYDKCYLRKDRSQPERQLEQRLEDSDRVVWWYKNEDSGKSSFAVRYEYDAKVSGFYPDYLVQYKDGTIGILEAKSTDDRDGKTITKAKAEALQDYLRNIRADGKRVKGGIVCYDGNRNNLFFNQEAEYRIYSEHPEDWTSLPL